MLETLPAHAEYPPSSLGNMEKCPGFRNRKNVVTPATERGDRIHKALETNTVELLEDEERGIGQMCVDYMDGIIQEHRPALFDQDIRERQGKMLMALGGDLETYGTPDRILIYGTLGEMFDFKSGYTEITDAEDNAQAWSYVIGAFQKYPQLETIKFHILIPVRDEIFTHTFQRSDLPIMKLRLNTIIRGAMEFDWSELDKIRPLVHKLNPQPELCEYCENQTNCPALLALTIKAAAKLGPGLPLPDDLLVNKERPEDIAKILRLCPIFEEWAKKQRAKALELVLSENVNIPGFKRMMRRTDRAVTSVLGAYNAIKDKISLADFLTACGSISIPSLEEFFKKAAKQGQKTKAIRDMEVRLRHAGVWKEQGTIHYIKEDKK